MNCVILQPSYIPWRGYFHQIAKADIFVFYDDVQYDARGWRNRNRIKTPEGSRWLTVPVHASGSQTKHIPINEIEISWNTPWNQEHLKTLTHSYQKAPFFKSVLPILEKIYGQNNRMLADLTINSTVIIARYLGISKTQFMRSSELSVSGTKTDRLIAVLKAVGADHYISGPSAAEYIEEDKLLGNQISLEFMEYNYPVYPQLYPPYDPFVSILDLMFMEGPESLKFIM
jgi:hypothetical protein